MDNDDKIIILGCVVDQHLIDSSIDTVDRAIKGLSQGDSSIDIDNVIELFNKHHEDQHLGVNVWTVTLEKIDSKYYVFGINMKKFPEDSTMKSIKEYIQSETKRIVKVDISVNVMVLEKKQDIIYHYETYTNDLNS